MPRKGGIRKRLGYDNDKKREGDGDTGPLESTLNGMMKKGKLTAPDVQAVSANVLKAMPASNSTASSSSAPLEKWAAAGSFGRHKR